MLDTMPRKGHIRRSLMDEIDPDAPLVCIRGERGVGKTRFLIDYAGEKCKGKRCLYASLNYFYFSVHTLYDFALSFVRDEEGEVLLLDQIFKYPTWAEELERVHRECPELRILFTTSSVMTKASDFGLLGESLRVYELRGFSFREYINFHEGSTFSSFSLDDILSSPKECIAQVISDIDPMNYMDSYLYGGGYYPPTDGCLSRDAALSDDELIKHLNMLLEVDVVYIRQIGPSYLPKIRQLLYTLANDTGEGTKQNISRLSDRLGISRATVMNYIHYLSDAGVIRPLYHNEEDEGTKKPVSIFIGNPNILSVLTLEDPDPRMMEASFLLSHLDGRGHPVTIPTGSRSLSSTALTLLVDSSKTLVIESDELRKSSTKDTYIIGDRRPQVGENVIPLWLFGFLY